MNHRRTIAVPVGAEDDLIREAYGSRDFHEGIGAFIEKRQTVWGNR